jgi:membrane-associated HD superfamily phosphohydrolase
MSLYIANTPPKHNSKELHNTHSINLQSVCSQSVHVLRRCMIRRVGKPVDTGKGFMKPFSVASQHVRDLTQVQLVVLVAFLLILVVFVADRTNGEGGGGLQLMRSLGWLNTLLMGLVTLPASRTSIWVWFFGISFERAVAFHRMVARLAWVSIVIHLVTAVVNLGTAIPLSSRYSAKSVPLYGFLSFLAVTAMAISAMDPIRRR